MLGLNPTKTDVIITTVILLLLLLMFYNHWKMDQKAKSSMEDKELNIKDLITGVRKALYEVDEERIKKNERALFQIKDFTLEVNFVVRENSKEQGEFQAKVITIGNERQYSAETIQKISLHMAAIPPLEETARPSSEPLPTDDAHVVGPKPASHKKKSK